MRQLNGCIWLGLGITQRLDRSDEVTQDLQSTLVILQHKFVACILLQRLDGRPDEDLDNDVRVRTIGWLDRPSHEALSLSSTSMDKIMGAYLDEAYWCVVLSQNWVVMRMHVDSDNESV